MVRAALGVLCALPVLHMTRGRPWQAALVVALLDALPMNMGHTIPNALSR
jgi:hypothetical protein